MPVLPPSLPSRTLPTLEREYVATGKVRWVFIQLPLASIHPNAVSAAQFVCSARQGKFWQAHDVLYQEQESGRLSRSRKPLPSVALRSAQASPGPDDGVPQGEVETLDEIRGDAGGPNQGGRAEYAYRSTWKDCWWSEPNHSELFQNHLNDSLVIAKGRKAKAP